MQNLKTFENYCDCIATTFVQISVCMKATIDYIFDASIFFWPYFFLKKRVTCSVELVKRDRAPHATLIQILAKIFFLKKNAELISASRLLKTFCHQVCLNSCRHKRDTMAEDDTLSASKCGSKRGPGAIQSGDLFQDIRARVERLISNLPGENHIVQSLSLAHLSVPKKACFPSFSWTAIQKIKEINHRKHIIKCRDTINSRD